MNFEELSNETMNKAIAYFVGLSFPLTKIVNLKGKSYLIGSINHNSNMVNQKDLASHYNSVYKLIANELGDEKILMKSNRSEEGTISKKEGFSLIVSCDGISAREIDKQLLLLAGKIESSNDEIKKEFVKGCFDGRGSWDTTAHYFSIDVDRDYPKQDIIERIITSLGIGVNINRRDKNHPKNDQIRIKKDSIDKFISDIHLYSICRKNLISKGLFDKKESE